MKKELTELQTELNKSSPQTEDLISPTRTQHGMSGPASSLTPRMPSQNTPPTNHEPFINSRLDKVECVLGYETKTIQNVYLSCIQRQRQKIRKVAEKKNCSGSAHCRKVCKDHNPSKHLPGTLPKHHLEDFS